MRKFFGFLWAIRTDPRIPVRNWVAVGFLSVWILSPIDLLPDWIPVVGELDDLAALLLILGYLFDSPDSEVLLEHWPWRREAFFAIRHVVRPLARFVPGVFKRWMFRFPKSAPRL